MTTSPPLLLAEEAYRQIKTMIVSGSLDQAIALREADLARRLGVSRTPVREALNRLSAEKLVTALPSGGYSIVQLTAADLEEVYEVRAALEGLAARLAAVNITRVGVAQIHDLLDDMERSVGSGDDQALADLNSRFHATIAQASQNKFLQSMLRSIHEIFERYRLPALSNDRRRIGSYDEHRNIATAIINRDAQQAEQTIKTHIDNALKLRRDALTEHRAPPREQQSRPEFRALTESRRSRPAGKRSKAS